MITNNFNTPSNKKIGEIFRKEKTYELRGICMLLIILHHCFLRNHVSSSFDSIFYNMGYLCTGLFFFLSGYGLFYSYNRMGEAQVSYLWMKLKKLLLPFIYIWVFLLLLKLFGIYTESMYLIDFVSLRTPNRSTWFFEVIVGVYILTFFICKCFKDFYIRGAILFLLTFIYIKVCMHYGMGPWWWNSILCYPMGFVTAKVLENRQEQQINIFFIFIAIGILFYFSNGVSILRSIFYSYLLLVIYALNKIRVPFLNYIGFNSLVFYFAGDVPYRLFSLGEWYIDWPVWILLSLIFATIIIYTEKGLLFFVSKYKND